MNDHDELGQFSISQVISTKPFKSFDSSTIKFLDELSREIFACPHSQKFTDLAAFGFFIRKGNIKLLRNLKNPNSVEYFMGIGVTLHIAPSNVPLNFAYSLVTSLICGNPSIVRVSSKFYEQTDILIALFNKVAERMEIMPIFSIIRYPHDSELNKKLSEAARIRMIWGGNETINYFKSMAVKPNVVDITFPNKYSITLIDAEYYLTNCNHDQIAKDFFTEVYTFDQNACTAPRAIIWIGKKNAISDSKVCFWKKLKKELVKRNYQPSMNSSFNHFSTYAIHASQNIASKNETAWINGLHVMTLSDITSDIFLSHPGEGLIYEAEIQKLTQINHLVNDDCQTITTVGELNNLVVDWIVDENIVGVDRICKLGTASSFNLDWDGKDLFAMMTRKFFYENS